MKQQLLTDLDKHIFGCESVFTRFLLGAECDPAAALHNFKRHLEWRRDKNVNGIQDSEEIPDLKIYSTLPNNFHFHDREGRPVWIIRPGTQGLVPLFK